MNTFRGATLPAYQRIAASLRDRITSGALAPGEQLPTEQELSEEFGVARQTVRNGLGALVAEGLVVSRRPHGHFVRQLEHMVYRPQAESRPQPATPEMDRYCQQITAEGRVPSQTIEVSLIKAPAEIAKRLELAEGELVVARRRVRFINGEPVNTNDSHFPLDIVRDSEIMSPADIAQGTNQYLADLGHPQARAIDEYFIRMPTPDEAQRLSLGAGTPVALHYVTGYTQDGRPVRCTSNVLPGDRHVIVYERAWE
ncbi:GntR family transcriptional regulator [Krasilnikovia sp. MM14-A1004]|uniref:GntR family transcriptional regulator n=1 Tax=Krasilnikovia sp. MM14-A1004 TaxID=3373541 RepID=UPI00399D4970